MSGPTCGCTDTCAKHGILDKLKGRMGTHGGKHHKGDCGCAPAPTTCCAPPPPPPAPVACCAPAPTCDTCAHGSRPNLFDKLKGHGAGKRHKGDCGCAPGCDGCTDPAVPTVPAPAKDMPKPMDPKKTSSDTVPQIAIPSTGTTVVVPPLPVKPVSGPKLNGSTSPY